MPGNASTNARTNERGAGTNERANPDDKGNTRANPDDKAIQERIRMNDNI